MIKRILHSSWLALVLLFIYLPVLMLAVYSFTDTATIGTKGNFSLQNYVTLFTTPELRGMIGGTFLLAFGSALVATILGTIGAIGAFYCKKGPKQLIQFVNQIPVINAAVSLVAHVIVLIILMLFFRMNIYAVIIANMFFAFLMCIMNALAIRKYSGYHQEIHKTFIVPGISSVIMGIITYIVYHGSYAVLKINAVSAMLAILAAVIVYAVVLLLLHGLTEEEIKKFPKGTLIVRVAKKLHLLK